jgi:hypothetical protein
MPSLRDLLPHRVELPMTHRPLLAFAAIVAVSLLSFYVHLLHESMALGDQMRERQHNATSLRSTNLVSKSLPGRLAPARRGSDAAGARAR